MQCLPNPRVEVAGGGPVHARDADVAPERDGADAVLDAVPTHLDERGREADVELARLHSHRTSGDEVAELVQEDQQEQAADDDEVGHATGSPSPA